MTTHSSHNVYLIHGWAANGRIFDPLRPLLPAHWQVHAPDLPGHGATPLEGAFNIAAAADQIAAQMPCNSDVLGWSLGGVVALFIAYRHPDKVRHLCLTASFAKFLATPAYPQGVSRSALDKMTALFEADFPKYMRQFLELQLLNTPDAGAVIDAVLPGLTAHGTPAALESALEALNGADARPFLPRVFQPALLVYGGKDGITPPRIGQYLQEHLPYAETVVIDKAAHTPFLSHPQEFAALLARFFG